jgi:acyl-CoA thioesterase
MLQMKRLDPQVRAIIESDPIAQHFGIKLLELRKGFCRVSMAVRRDMLNFHGVAQAGAIFTLADYAFAGASNSHGTRALALFMDIALRRPAFEGDELTAEACEEHLGERTALYRIEVRNQEGKLVAALQGLVFRTGESLVRKLERGKG